MATDEKTLGELRYEWGQQESRTRQVRVYALQKLSIYSAFAERDQLEEFLKMILSPDMLNRTVPEEKIQELHEALSTVKLNRIFADLIEPLGLFRPFEVALFRAAIGGRCLHEAFVALEAYYDWNRANSPSAYGEFYYRLGLLLGAGVPVHQAIMVIGEKDRVLYELTEELVAHSDPYKSVADFFADAEFPEWQTAVIKAAESKGRVAEALIKLSAYSSKSISY